MLRFSFLFVELVRLPCCAFRNVQRICAITAEYLLLLKAAGRVVKRLEACTRSNDGPCPLPCDLKLDGWPFFFAALDPWIFGCSDCLISLDKGETVFLPQQMDGNEAPALPANGLDAASALF